MQESKMIQVLNAISARASTLAPRLRVGVLATATVLTLGAQFALASDRPDATRAARSPKKYLIVVAHPDDENMIGSVLAKWARQGHRVRVVIATDGKYGTRVTDVPEGELLGGLRQSESKCACDKLGIEPPVFLSIDRLDTRSGVRQYLNARKVLLAALETHIERFTPDAIFTFGPDGEYGHPEHIVIGAAVTETLLRLGWVSRYPLYYLAWTKEQVADNPELAYVDRRYLDLKVTHSDADEKRMLEAAKCYETQTTPKEIDELTTVVTTDKSNTIYFRRFFARSSERRARRLEEM